MPAKVVDGFLKVVPSNGTPEVVPSNGTPEVVPSNGTPEVVWDGNKCTTVAI